MQAMPIGYVDHVQSDDDGSLEPLITTEFAEMNGEISPDGGLLAYQSNASGQHEIYVRSFPDVNRAQWPISSGGRSAISAAVSCSAC